MKNKQSGTPTYVRIIALIMCILMVVGVGILLIQFLATSVFSADAQEINYDGDENDMRIRIGLLYGSSVVDHVSLTTLAGFSVGLQNLNDEARSFTPFFSTNLTKLSVAADGNLKKKDGKYELNKSSTGTTIGGYHLQVDKSFWTYDECMKAIKAVEADLAKVNLTGGCYAFPYYDNEIFYIRIYDFASEDSAVGKITKFSKIFSGQKVTAVKPSKETTTLIDPSTDRILFEFHSSGQDKTLGLKPLPYIDHKYNEDYITLDSRLYQDVLCFRNEASSSSFSVINVIRLEEYVEGVMPYEISTYWPLETQKAFAILIRTYALQNLGRRQKLYGFDLVNNSSDQVYKGAGSVNALIREAVAETKGIIMVSDGKIAEIYYANCFGDTSVGAADVWGGSYPPYLKAVKTPWESYQDSACKGGFWVNEVSAKDLCTYLKKEQGFKDLKGTKITSVQIMAYAENSSYVKTIKITDNEGNTIYLDKCSNVRNAFIKYVYSANFVVGKGKVIYTLDSVEKVTKEEDLTFGAKVQTILQDLKELFVQSIYGTSSGDGSSGTYVLTAEGETMVTDAVNVEYSNLVSVGPKYKASTETKIHYCNDSETFVFVGKGYGHGVGISQYGAKCLGEFGYTCEEIISMYFTGIDYADRIEFVK